MNFNFNKNKNVIGMATVAACSGLTIQQANAAIIYNDINPDAHITASSGSYSYDVNNDGVNDFYVNSSLTYGSSLVYNGTTYTNYTYSFTAGGYNGNQVAAGTKLLNGDSVDSSLNFVSDGLLRQYSVEYGTYVTTCSYKSSTLCTQLTYDQYFAGNYTGNGYLGLKLNDNGNTYYGWSDLYVDVYAKEGYLRGDGYENWSDTPILAGQTVNPATVPEPGTLALLAAGAAGLAAVRRRKQKQR